MCPMCPRIGGGLKEERRKLLREEEEEEVVEGEEGDTAGRMTCVSEVPPPSVIEDATCGVPMRREYYAIRSRYER